MFHHNWTISSRPSTNNCFFLCNRESAILAWKSSNANKFERCVMPFWLQCFLYKIQEFVTATPCSNKQYGCTTSWILTQYGIVTSACHINPPHPYVYCTNGSFLSRAQKLLFFSLLLHLWISSPIYGPTNVDDTCTIPLSIHRIKVVLVLISTP